MTKNSKITFKNREHDARSEYVYGTCVQKDRKLNSQIRVGE